VVIALGLMLRLVTLRQYVGQIDEPASLMAIKRVSEIGYPLYPSGVLYLQGAVFSYIGAPLTWVFTDSSLPGASRILYLLLAISVIPLSMKLAHMLSGSTWIAVFVGVLVACDPNLIIWSVTIRPYGLLVAEITAVMVLFTRLLESGPEARLPVGRVVFWVPVLATIGTFTHIGFWLTVPPLALVAIAVWKRKLLGSHRAILISGLASLAPLLVFLLLGRFVGTGSGTTDGALGNAFVGSHLFSLERFLDPASAQWIVWNGNFFAGNLHRIMPWLIGLASIVVVYGAFIAPARSGPPWRRQAIAAVVVVHWSVIVAAAFISADPEPRYLTQILPLGYLLVGLAVWWACQQSALRPRPAMRWLQIGAAILLMGTVLIHAASASAWRMSYPGGDPDYWNATRWAAEHRTSDQVVITALPPAAFTWFAEQGYDRLIFLAGHEESQRTERYIKPNTNGEPGDYWLGVPSIGSTGQLCGTLREHAGAALIVLDRVRLMALWSLGGEMEGIIRGSTVEEHRGINGVMVLSVVPLDRWTPDARSACGM
jgi:hypothetical protein